MLCCAGYAYWCMPCATASNMARMPPVRIGLLLLYSPAGCHVCLYRMTVLAGCCLYCRTVLAGCCMYRMTVLAGCCMYCMTVLAGCCMHRMTVLAGCCLYRMTVLAGCCLYRMTALAGCCLYCMTVLVGCCLYRTMTVRSAPHATVFPAASETLKHLCPGRKLEPDDLSLSLGFSSHHHSEPQPATACLPP